MKFFEKVKTFLFGSKEEREEAIIGDVNRDKILSGEYCYLCGQEIEKGTGKKIEQWKVHFKCLRAAKKQVRKDLGMPGSGRLC